MKQIRRDIYNSVIFRNRWWQHILFWAAAFVILLNLFKSSGSITKIDLIYTSIFMIPIIGIVYTDLYLFIPRLLRRERYLLFVLGVGVLIFLGAVLIYLLFDRWIDYILSNYYFISYYSIPHLMLYTGSFILLSTLLKLSRSWFKLLRMERITSENRLKSLQSQVNPHFLLNSLQTIYALSLEQSLKTPEVILQLSDILKYALYETENPKVDLEQELKLLKNYIDMYRLRTDKERSRIDFYINGTPDNLKIAPMLFLPFIENSFKHGLQGDELHGFVRTEFNIEKEEIDFRIENNIGQTDHSLKEGKGGIGIENTRQRLELLYPGKHNLEISRSNDIFKVSLSITLKE